MTLSNHPTSTVFTATALLGSLALLGCSSDPEPASEPARDPLPASFAERLQTTLDEVVAAGVAPGASLTVEHPEYRTWSGASGVGDLETMDALTPASRFRAGSMLKTWVATAVLQLVERGELSLDQSLTDLLPASVTARIPGAEEITLDMLLKHTSGLGEFSTEALDAEVARTPARVWSFDELLDHGLAEPAANAPGAGWYYSNTNYLLLGRILDDATGEPWRTTVRERVLARAGLESSELPEEGDPQCNGCARGYHPVGNELLDLTEVDPSMAGPAGGSALVTTPADLARLVRALSEGRLFGDPATFDRMRDFVEAPIPEEGQAGYGLGLQQFRLGEVELIGHLGGTAGYQGFTLVNTQNGVVASGYINRYGGLGGFILPVLEALAEAP